MEWGAPAEGVVGVALDNPGHECGSTEVTHLWTLGLPPCCGGGSSAVSDGDQHTETALVRARRDSYTLLGTELRALCRALWLSGPLPTWGERTCKTVRNLSFCAGVCCS